MTTGISCPSCGQWVARAIRPTQSASRQPKQSQPPAFQLDTRLPDYRKLLLTLPKIAELDRKDAAELFDYLLANPLRSVIGGGRERHLIVLDALDEAGEAGCNPIVEMLARHAPRLPDRLGLVVTSRVESAVKTLLQGVNPFVLDTRAEANRADLRDCNWHEPSRDRRSGPCRAHVRQAEPSSQKSSKSTQYPKFNVDSLLREQTIRARFTRQFVLCRTSALIK